MIILEILKAGEVVNSHSSVNLVKITFDFGGFTVRTSGSAAYYPYSDGYQFRTR